MRSDVELLRDAREWRKHHLDEHATEPYRLITELEAALRAAIGRLPEPQISRS